MRKEQIRVAITVLKEYLLHKAEECDWHGISDAANDLRVLEAELKGLANGGN
jgi:hypothetical protein